LSPFTLCAVNHNGKIQHARLYSAWVLKLIGDFRNGQIWQSIKKRAVELSQALALCISKLIATVRPKTATRRWMPDIPIHIDDAEVIVRAIFEPYHEKKEN
ncbi:MAG: hypothetical protein ACRERU_03410, partial [Methylococcales bacterium]